MKPLGRGVGSIEIWHGLCNYGDCILAPLPKPESPETSGPACRYHWRIIHPASQHVNDIELGQRVQKLPRQRLRRVPSMFDSLEVQVLYTT